MNLKIHLTLYEQRIVWFWVCITMWWCEKCSLKRLLCLHTSTDTVIDPLEKTQHLHHMEDSMLSWWSGGLEKMSLFYILISTAVSDVPRCVDNNVGEKPFCFPADYNKVSATNYKSISFLKLFHKKSVCYFSIGMGIYRSLSNKILKKLKAKMA